MAAKKKEKSIEESLWDSANKLRGTVEPSEYKRMSNDAHSHMNRIQAREIEGLKEELKAHKKGYHPQPG